MTISNGGPGEARRHRTRFLSRPPSQCGYRLGSYAEYQWDPAAASLTSVDFNDSLQVDPGYRANVLWYTRFVLSGSNQIGRTGMEDNANVGANFLFTVLGVMQYKSGAPGSYCVVHTGDDPGVTCRLPYNWIFTHTYQFHVAYEGGQ